MKILIFCYLVITIISRCTYLVVAWWKIKKFANKQKKALAISRKCF